MLKLIPGSVCLCPGSARSRDSILRKQDAQQMITHFLELALGCNNIMRLLCASCGLPGSAILWCCVMNACALHEHLQKAHKGLNWGHQCRQQRLCCTCRQRAFQWLSAGWLRRPEWLASSSWLHQASRLQAAATHWRSSPAWQLHALTAPMACCLRGRS